MDLNFEISADFVYSSYSYLILICFLFEAKSSSDTIIETEVLSKRLIA